MIPFRIEEVQPSRSLQYFIGPQHWLDAWTPPLEQHLHRLTESIKALLTKRLEGFDAAGREPGLKPPQLVEVKKIKPPEAQPQVEVVSPESDEEIKRKIGAGLKQIKPAELPSELKESIEAFQPWVREGAASLLAELLQGSDKPKALMAYEALKRLKDDDSLKVRSLVYKILEEYAARQPAEAVKTPAAPPAVEQERPPLEEIAVKAGATAAQPVEAETLSEKPEPEEAEKEPLPPPPPPPELSLIETPPSAGPAVTEPQLTIPAKEAVPGRTERIPEMPRQEPQPTITVSGPTGKFPLIWVVSLVALLVVLVVAGGTWWRWSQPVVSTPKVPAPVASRQLLATLTGHGDVVRGVAFSPNGKILASASWDSTVRLWDVASRQPLATLTGHESWVTSVAFSPDGKILASASEDKNVRLWDVSTRQPLATLTGHESYVSSVAFSPNGKILARASWVTVRLWDVASRQPLATLTGHEGIVESVAFSPDGRLLASASADETVRLWDLTTLSDRRP